MGRDQFAVLYEVVQLLRVLCFFHQSFDPATQAHVAHTLKKSTVFHGKGGSGDVSD